MGKVIDFQSYANRRAREADRRERGVAPDYTTLRAPHRWPAGQNPAEDNTPQAQVNRLPGTFRDNLLFAGFRRQNGYYQVLQYAPGTTPESMADAQPVDYFHIPPSMMDDEFTPLPLDASAPLSYVFARAAQAAGDSAAQARLYTRAVASVHVITAPGMHEFAHDDTPQNYAAGTAVIAYKGGHLAVGPAADILPLITPADEKAAAAMAQVLAAFAPNDPDGFKF